MQFIYLFMGELWVSEWLGESDLIQTISVFFHKYLNIYL